MPSASGPKGPRKPQRPGARPGERSGDRSGTRTGERSGNRAGGRPDERLVDRPRGKPAERSGERAGERAGGRSGTRTAERAGAKPGERYGERSGAKPGERSGPRTGTGTGPRSNERAGGKAGERFGERSGPRTSERAGERPAARPTDRSGAYGSNGRPSSNERSATNERSGARPPARTGERYGERASSRTNDRSGDRYNATPGQRYAPRSGDRFDPNDGGERRIPPPRIRRGPKLGPQVRQAAADGTAREGDRIAKLLARAGIASRRDIERMIEEGRIELHGEVVTTPATLLTSLEGVTVDGDFVNPPSPTRLFLYHKPVGLLTTARDPAGRPTIYDRLPDDLPRVMPVGRLDLNTEGLLLLTTDGEFKRELELPATGVERTYRARAFGEVAQAQLEALIEGVEIEGMRYGRIDANLERRTGRNQWIEMTLTEGKNREVRRVLEHLELKVNRLIRTRYGPFVLGDSPPGAVVEVQPSDIAQFRKTLK